jgi:hypothetical protein
MNNNGRGLGIGRQAWLATSKLPKTTWNVSCHRVWMSTLWLAMSMLLILKGSNPYPTRIKENK